MFFAAALTAASRAATVDYTNGQSNTTNYSTTTLDPLLLRIFNGDTATQSGVLSGDGNLTLSGSGILLLSGANTYTGSTTVTGATLRIGTTGALGAGALILDGGTFTTTTGLVLSRNTTLNAGSNTFAIGNGFLTFNGNVSGVGGFTKTGGSILTLAGAHTYTGATTVSAGTLKFAANGATASTLATSSLAIASGAKVIFADSQTYAGTTSGAGVLEHEFSGTTILTGAAGHTGGTNVTGGTIQIGNGGTTGSLAGNVALSSNGTLAFNRSDAVTFSGAVTGTGGLSHLGTGTLTLSGTNTFSGPVAINAGTLQLSGGAALADTSAVTLANSAGATLALSSSETIGSLAGGGANGGNVSLGANTLTVGAANTSTTYGGVISGSGGFTKSGSGTLTLTGPSNYTGTTTIAGGTLLLAPAGAVVGGASLLLDASRGVTTNGSGAVTGWTDLSGAGNSATAGGGSVTVGTLSSGRAALYFGANSYLSDPLASSGSAYTIFSAFEVPSAAGDQTLLGSSQNGDLQFRVSGGSLQLLQQATSILATSSGGSVTASTPLLGTATVTSGTQGFYVGASSAGSGSATFTLPDGGTFRLGGNLLGGESFGGGISLLLVFDSVLSPTRIAEIQTQLLTALSNGSSLQGYTLPAASTVDLTASGAALDLNHSYQAVAGLSGVAGSQVLLGGGTLEVGSSGANTTFAGAIQDGGNNPATGGSLVKVGAGTLTLSGTNTFSGATTINAGTLQLSGGAALADTSAVILANTAGATLALSSSETIGSLAGGGTTGGNVSLGTSTLTVGGDNTSTTYSGVISGSGSIAKTGTGTLTLAGANTYAGGTNIAGGTIQVGNGGSAGSLAGNVALSSNATLAFNRSDAVTFSGAVTGTGGLSHLGTGTLTLSGANTFSGATTVNAGTLQLSGGAALGDTSAVTLANTAGAALALSSSETIGSLAGGGASGGNVSLGTSTLTVGAANTSTTYGGVISGSGGLTKSGSGTLTLTGPSTYTGTTTIAGGTVLLAPAGANFGGASLLLDASRGVTTNGSGAVTGWTDFSGAGNNATAGGGTVTLGTLSSGRAALYFGANSYLSDPLASSGSAYTIFSVFEVPSAAGNQTFLGSSQNGDLQFRISGGSLQLLQQATSILATSNGGSVTASTSQLGTVTVTSGAQGFFVGASSAGSGSATFTLPDGGTFRLGGNLGGGESFGGGISLLLVFDSVLSPTRIADIQTQLLTALANGSGLLGYTLPTATTVDLTASGAALDLNQSYQVIAGLSGVAGSQVLLGGGTLEVGSSGANTTFAGAIQDGGNNPATGGRLIKVGPGTLTLSGTNTFSGPVAINAGTLQLSGGAALADTSAVTLANTAGATLALSSSETIGSLAGGGTTGGNVSLGTSTLTVGGANTSTTFAGVISGAGGLTKTGTGTLTLSGANAFSGATTINAGTLQLSGSAGLADTSAVVLANTAGATLALSASETIGSLAGGGATGGNVSLGANTLTAGGDNTSTTFGGVISGSGGLAKTGTGTLTLAGANTFSGTTTINAGTLQLSSGAALPNTSTVVLADVAGATLALSTSKTIASLSGGGASGGNVSLGTNTLTLGGNNASTTYGGAISGGGGLVKTGSGTLTLSGANTFSGGLGLDAGTLALGSSGALGSTGTIGFNGGTLQSSAANTTDYSARFSTAAGQAYKIDTNGQAVTFAAALTSSGGSLTKSGAGTLTLSGANTFSGATTINAGTLQLSGGAALADTAAVTLANTAGVTLALASSETIGSLAGGGTTGGNVSLGTSTLTVGANDTSTTYAGVLSGTGGLTKTGSGTLTLTGASTYAGGTTLNAGTLAISSASALGSGALAFGGGTLRTTGNLTLTQDISASAGILFETASGTLTASGAISTASALTKLGSGTLALSGSNTVSGGVNLNAGTLALGSSGALGSTGTIGFNGGTLQSSAANTTDYSARFSTAAGQAYKIDTNGQDVTLASALTSSGGSFTKSGAGTLTLSGANTFSGATTINGGTLLLSSGAALADTAAVTFANTAGATLALASSKTIGSLAGGGSTGGNVSLGANTLTVGGNDASTAYGGAISGSGSLTKTGAGTLTLSGASTYAGGTDLNAGTLAISSGSALGSGALHFGGGTLRTNGNLTLTQDISASTGILFETASGTLTASGAISTTSAFSKLGGGTLALAGNNTFSGGIGLAEGTLTLGSSGALGSTGTISFNGGTLQSSAANTTDYSARFSTAAGQAYQIDTNGQDVTLASALTSSGGSLTKSGAGTLTLTGANTYTGGTTLNAGTLALGSAGALGSSGTISFNGGTLQYSAANTTDYSARFSTAGQAFAIDTNGQDITFGTALSSAGSTLAKLGAGSLTLTGNTSFGTVTQLGSGTLTLTGNNAITAIDARFGSVVIAGAATGDYGYVGYSEELEGRDGSVSVSGPDASWTISSGLYVGAKYDRDNVQPVSGSLTISNGASMSANYMEIGTTTQQLPQDRISTGSVLVTGAGSSLHTDYLQLGYGGAASLAIADGAKVTATGSASLGSNNYVVDAALPRPVSVTIAGAGSSLAAGDLILGSDDGTATHVTIAVSGGGVLTSVNARAGTTWGGATLISVSGAGSEWSAENSIDLGSVSYGSDYLFGATAELTLSEAGKVTVAGGDGTLTLAHFLRSDLGPGHGTVNLGAAATAAAAAPGIVNAAAIEGAEGVGLVQFNTTGTALAPTYLTKDGTATGAPVALTGNLSVIHTAGTTVLQGANTYTGGTTLNGGTLSVSADRNLGDASGALAFAGGTLHNTASFTAARATTLGTGGGTFDTASGTTLTWTGEIDGAAGGTLAKSGAGTLTLSGANTYAGGTTVSAGTLAAGHVSAFGTGVVRVDAGTLDLGGYAVANALDIRGGTLSGLAGYSGTQTVRATASYSGNIGGTLLVADGGRVNTTGATFTGATTIQNGGTLSGTGAVGTLSIASGGTLSPGNSPGTMTAGATTFAGGGTFVFELNDATGTAGTNWDLLAISGALSIAATSVNPFIIDLTSLTLANAAGAAAGFDSTADYSFTFLTTTGGITGFAADQIVVSATHFSNPFAGTWSVSLGNSGHDLTLNYAGASAVPEPSTHAAFAGLAALGLVLIRRRRLSRS